MNIKCALGWHEFYATDIEMHHIVDDTYRATMVCRKCRVKQCGLIRVPVPPWIKTVNPGGNDADEKRYG